MKKKQIFLQFAFSYYYGYIIAYKNIFKKFMTQFYKNDLQSLELCMWVRPSFSDLEKKYFLKAQKHIRNLRFIPWLRYVAIWNSVAMKSSHEKSDIDLFVITEKNRLWLVRICMTFYFFMRWLRKTEHLVRETKPLCMFKTLWYKITKRVYVCVCVCVPV